MRGYDKSQIRVMGGSGYKLSIAIIAVLAAILLVFMLIILPAIEEEPKLERRIVSIEYPEGDIGIGDDLSKIHVEIHYSDGDMVLAALTDTLCEGLDRTKEGRQNVSITYGGFEQVVPINVKSVDCEVTYTASTGGSIEGGALTQYIPSGGKGDSVRAVPEVGYVFVNWSDGNPREERKDINVTADASYTANFEKAKYTVIFRYPDGTVAREQNVPYNEQPTQIPAISDTKMQVYGYVFDKWSLPFERVTQDMTIDPIFKKHATDVNVTITTDNRGDRLGRVDLPKEGYYPKSKLATLRANPMQARSFASWQIKSFGGQWVTIDLENIRSGEDFKNIDIGRVGNNITFRAGQTGDSLEYYLEFMPTDDTELIEIRANFVYDESTITFINSMSPEPGNIEKTVGLPNGQEIGDNLTNPDVSIGYNFIGWFMEDGSKRDEEGNEIAVDRYEKFTQPMTLIARWQKKFFEVIFIGEGEQKHTVYVLYQDTLAAAVADDDYNNIISIQGIPLWTPNKEHYIFVGWYLEGEGGVLTDTVIDENYKIYEDIYVKPKYVPISHNLTLELIGAGFAERMVLPSGSYQPIDTGINKIEETRQYKYRFTAEEGYQIKRVIINDEVRFDINDEKITVLWRIEDIYNPDSDRRVIVEFMPRVYNITIKNGFIDDRGTISYKEIIDDVIVERSSDSTEITLFIEHNTSKNINIRTRSTHFIEKVSIGQHVLDNIPPMSTEYTIVLSQGYIVEDTTIKIEYRAFAYTVDIIDSDEVSTNEVYYNEMTDSYVHKAKSSSYSNGESPLFLYEASEGYYITGLIINGKKVDLYSPDFGFNVLSITINNLERQESGDATEIKDDRITSFVLEIEEISSNFVIEAIYTPLYYSIFISHEGRGVVETDYVLVGYKDSIQITAETDGGYYVKSYILNEVAYEFEDALELQTIDINDIVTDIYIAINFSIAVYDITFDGSANNGMKATVRKDNQEYKNLNLSYPAEHNSSNSFTLVSQEGYYISKIIINGQELVIPNKVLEYNLQIDNVTKQQHIIINCARLQYTVRTVLNNILYGSVTSDVIVKHGENAVIELSYNDGYSLMDVSEGEVSSDYSQLIISAVTQDEIIYINFAPRIYNIRLSSSIYGQIISPATAMYNDELFIFVEAFEGYIIDKIFINTVELLLPESFSAYAFSSIIVEDININVEFMEYSFSTWSQVIIYQTNGWVNGQNGNCTINIYDNIWATALIKAPAYHYISSITGQTIDNEEELTEYILFLDGSLNSIEVEYKAQEYNISLNNPTNGTAELLVAQTINDEFIPSQTASYGNYIKIMFYPEEGYAVDQIRINGSLVFDYIENDLYYIYTGFHNNQIIEINYKPKRLNILTEVSGGQGIISTEHNHFIYGQDVIFRIIPNVGYKISDIVINEQAISGQDKQTIINTNLFVIIGGSIYSKEDILLRVSFEQIYQTVSVTIEGAGRITQAAIRDIAYGDYCDIDITAEENNYIQAIEIDGIRMGVDSSNLHNYTQNPITHKFISGRYTLHTTKNINIKIIFARNVYSVKIISSVNGITLANLIDAETGESELNITEIEHGNFIQIRMEANTGYNISRLFINNREIYDFKPDNVNPNNNRKIDYIYTGTNAEGVNNNILIRVDYNINYYKFQFETKNESPNFKDFDVNASSYGTISMLGNYTLTGNVYSGIAHGENFQLSIEPVRERGYVISGVTITYMDPANPQQSVITITPQVGGSGATIPRTGVVLFFSELMGQYAQVMVGDVEKIQVRFTKETFEYTQEVVTSPLSGTISTRIYHPNDSSRVLTVGSSEPTSLIVINGKYEYGLGYTVTVVSSVGYTRTSFYFISGSSTLDRNNSIRGNTYNSIIQSDLHAKVEYTVNTYDLQFSYLVYSYDGTTLINNPGDRYGTIKLLVNNQEFFPTNRAITIRCDYNSFLNFVATPAYTNEGYYIHSFVVGNKNVTNDINNKNEEFIHHEYMPNSDLVATVIFRINTYDISFIHEGADGRNSVVSETPGLIPWGWGAVLRLNTDEGYNLLSLEVYQNGQWNDRFDDIIYNHMYNHQYRDILEINDIKEDIIVKTVYQRKEYDINVVVNDLTKGAIRLDIIGDFYENHQNIAQEYTERVEESEGWIYDPILNEEYWGTIVSRWDIITMQARHYDELLFYLMPIEGYRIKEIMENGEPRFDRVKVELFNYRNGERQPVRDNYGNPIVYYINTSVFQDGNVNHRTFSLPLGQKLTSNIEVCIDFILKDYSIVTSKKPTELEGVGNSVILIEKLQNGSYAEISHQKVDHFEELRVTLDLQRGLTLNKMIINNKEVEYTSYVFEDSKYTFYFEFVVNDILLNELNIIAIEVLIERINYDVEVTIYDNKSQQLTNGRTSPTLLVECVYVVSYGNLMPIRPILSEGYSVIDLIINDVYYTPHISNLNAQFNLNISGELVSNLDVYAQTNIIKLEFTTNINFHKSDIRAFVYESGIDDFSDVAGDTTIIYNPEDTMVIIDNQVKYEYFTHVTAIASARVLPDKTYRFAYFQEQISGLGWRTVKDGERGITLSGEDNSVMDYTIEIDERAGVLNADRVFRVVYFRVLTVNVGIIPPHKYISGNYTMNNMKYTQYLTIQAMVGDDIIEDKNPQNAPIYAMARRDGVVAYVEVYTYHIDSGSYLKLEGIDHASQNTSLTSFYSKVDSTTYHILNEATGSGIKILEDRELYAVCRNETMLSFEISTIKNERNAPGGNLNWSIMSKDNSPVTAVTYRGSMTTAKVLDTVTIEVKPSEHYRFNGLYVKNINELETKETGELIFMPEGSPGEWTLIDTSTELIKISQGSQGSTIFQIFVTSNMVMKFEFYRTFKLTYDIDYQETGNGPGEVHKDAGTSSTPIHTQISGGEVQYELYDYNSQIKLVTPPTDDDYQFVGWLVNGENVYADLLTSFPEEAYYSHWFRLYQNNASEGIFDGLNLQHDNFDVYEVHIVAIYQPIYKLAIINESFFYDSVDDHWNTWLPSSVTVRMYEYFSQAQVSHGDTGNNFSLASSSTNNEIIMDYDPSKLMDVYNYVIPPRVFASSYDGIQPEWSQIREIVNANSGKDWNSRMVFSETNYYKMLYQRLSNPLFAYNTWSDNILYLETSLSEGMALVEWQYYNFNENKFETIPYVDNPILNGDVITGYVNSAQKTSYYIDLSQCHSFIDHTKPFIIRPQYQKKVTLILDKKAYYDFLGDNTFVYNSRQMPEIYGAPGARDRATFDYYTKCLIIPRAANEYRFINWYTRGNTVDDTLILTTLSPEDSTAAWEVHLKFEYNAQELQNERYLQGRYIKQWEIRIESQNVSQRGNIKRDCPKIILERIYDLEEHSTVTDTTRYVLHSQGDVGDNEDYSWVIHLTIDAGLAVDARMNFASNNTITGYNPEFDKLFKAPQVYTDEGEYMTDTINDYGDLDIATLRVVSHRLRTLIISYESFGELIFENLMWYAGIRLTDAMSTNIQNRFEEFGSGPIVVKDADDGVIDGKASFNRIPIREIDYLGNLSYGYVPYGYNLEADSYIEVNRVRLNDSAIENAHFDSRKDSLLKRVTIDYKNYRLFGIEKNTEVPGTETNPYLIGAKLDGTGGVSVAETRTQFNNIELFYDYNGTSCDGVAFKLMADIHLNSVTASNPTWNQVKSSYNWVPICYKGEGFNGIILGNGKTLRSLHVDGESSRFVVTDINSGEADEDSTTYNYLQHGYGVFTRLHNATIKNLKIGTVALKLDRIRDKGNSLYSLIEPIGILAAHMTGSENHIENIEIVETETRGYIDENYNIYIKAIAASKVGAIIGNAQCSAVSGTINSIIKDIEMKPNIFIQGVNHLGGFVGYMEEIKVDNITFTDMNPGRPIDNIIKIDSISAKNYLGGAIGTALSCDIQNSYITTKCQVGSISTAVAGGFIGQLGRSSSGLVSLIKNCYIEARSENKQVKLPDRRIPVVGGWATGAPRIIMEPGETVSVHNPEASTYVKTATGNIINTSADQGVEDNSAGGFIGLNSRGEVDNCTIRGTIMLYGSYCGGVIGHNEGGIVRNINLKSSSKDFYVRVNTSYLSNGAFGIIAGANTDYSSYGVRSFGLITDCGIEGSNVSIDEVNINDNTARLYVYPSIPTGKTLDFQPGIDDIEACWQYPEIGGETSVGGLLGVNSGKLYNSYVKKIKVLAMKNATPPFNVNMGGVVGYNNVSTTEGGKGVSSCFSESNALVLSNILWSPSPSALLAGVGIGGVAGGSNGGGNSIADFSVRYCYGINNKFYVTSANYGANFKDGSEYGIFVKKKYDNPDNNKTKIRMIASLIVGGATREKSRAYYCWGGTNSSWQNIEAVYGNYFAGKGGSLRNGASRVVYYLASDNPDYHPEYNPNVPQFLYALQRITNRFICSEPINEESEYGNYWDSFKEDKSFRGRLMILDVSFPNSTIYQGGAMGENKPAVFGGFIGRINSQNKILDSRVIKTDEVTGKPLYVLLYTEFDSNGNYIGTRNWSDIEASIVPGQTKYTYG